VWTSGSALIDKVASWIIPPLCRVAIIFAIVIGLGSCVSRIGTFPPPVSKLEHIEARVQDCLATKRSLVDQTVVVVRANVAGSSKMFVSPPDVLDKVLSACSAVRNQTVMIGYSSGSYKGLSNRDLNPELKKRQDFSLGSFPYVWDISFNGRPVGQAGYERLSRTQTLWNLFMIPAMFIVAVIALFAYIGYAPTYREWLNS